MKPSVRASSVEGLRKELKDLRRSVMDLHRITGDVGGTEPIGQTEPEPAGGGGGPAEAFRYNPYNSFVGDYVMFDSPSYVSSGVSLSNSDTQIDVPLGLWHVDLRVMVYATGTAPSSGIVRMGVSTSGGGGSVSCGPSAFDARFVRLGTSFDFLMAGLGGGIRVQVDENTFDQPVEFDFSINGHLIADAIA